MRNVNLAEIATVFPGRAKEKSHYKRIQRFLRFFQISYARIAALIVALMGVPRLWALTLDRGNWQLGQTPLNILVPGIVYKGVAIPVLWTLLAKKGNPNTAERQALVCEFTALSGSDSTLYLSADREFIGKTWFQWLKANQIAFRIRVRDNSQITNGRGQVVAARRVVSPAGDQSTLELCKSPQALGTGIVCDGDAARKWRVSDRGCPGL